MRLRTVRATGRVSTSGSHVANGSDTFYGRTLSDGQHEFRVSGAFAVTTATGHLNVRTDGYGYTKLVQRTANGTTHRDQDIRVAQR